MKISKLINILNEIPRIRNDKKSRRKYLIIACAMDKKGKVLAIRTNNYNRTHPVQKHFAELANLPESIYLHAEISALIAAKKDVHKLIIARVDADGRPLIAKPCPICELAIKSYGVQEVEYTK